MLLSLRVFGTSFASYLGIDMAIGAFLKKHFWIAHLIVLATCVFFLAKAVNYLALGSIPRPEAKKTKQARLPVSAASLYPTPRDSKPIIERNIFCSAAKCDPKEEVIVEKVTEEVNLEPIESSLPFKLYATMVSPSDPRWSFATVLNTETNYNGLYAPGHKLIEGVAVESVEERRMYLSNHGKPEYIDLIKSKDSPKKPKSVSASSTSKSRSSRSKRKDKMGEEFGKGVTKKGEHSWEIQRGALDKILNNTAQLVKGARIVPASGGGFKLFAVKPGSVYDILGLKNGDKLHSINGNEMSSPDKALELYTKLRSASHLTLGMERSGKSITNDYSIR